MVQRVDFVGELNRSTFLEEEEDCPDCLHCGDSWEVFKTLSSDD